MSKLDKLIENLKEGEVFLMETNKEPMVQSGSDEPVAILNQPLSGAQIKALVLEIAPEHVPVHLEMAGDAAFAYSVGEKGYSVSIRAEGDAVKTRITQGGIAPKPLDQAETPTIAAAPDLESPKPPEADKPQPAPDLPKAPVVTAPEGGPAIDSLFYRMINDGASDLHLSSGSQPILRVSGELVKIADEETITPEHMKKLLYEIMPKDKQAEFESINDTDFPYEIEGLSRFRANVFMDRLGMGAVFRQIPFEILTTEQLALSQNILDLCYLSKGLVLITGPTGSGKSTTLAALIDFINRNRTQHIITIEDPIEFVHPNKECLINQREIKTHTSSYSNALRAALREDPDIVLVGEMRDLETISIALETAETGHLVFGTLHTSTAASTVDRIIDQFPSDRQEQIRTMLSGSLKGVVAQTLCKKKGGGRVAALEVMLVNAAVSNLIREGKVFQIPSIIQTSKGSGMELLNDALMRLVTDDVIEPEEAYIRAVDKSGISALLKTKGIALNLRGTTEEE